MTLGSISNCARLIDGTPYWRLRRAVISSSLTTPRLDQVVPELAPVGLLMVQGLLELVRCDAFLLEEEFADADGHVSLVVSVSRGIRTPARRWCSTLLRFRRVPPLLRH